MEKSFRRMSNPAVRRAFVKAEVATSLAHQIRVLRIQRGWTQGQLAKKLKSTQAAVSRLEDPSYGSMNLKTLLELGQVFDVALNVRFQSLTKFFVERWLPKRADLEVEPFDIESAQVGFVLAASAEQPAITFNVSGPVAYTKVEHALSSPPITQYGGTSTASPSSGIRASLDGFVTVGSRSKTLFTLPQVHKHE